MNDPSDAGRAAILRYRGSISPSDAQRELLVAAVVARIAAPGVAAIGGTTAATRGGVPWLVVVGVGALLVGVGAWIGRAPGNAAPLITALGGMAGIEAPIAAPAIEHDAPTELAAAAIIDGPGAPTAVVAPPTDARSDPDRGARSRRRDPRAAPVPAAAPAIEAAPALVDEEVRLLREANLALRNRDDAQARARLDEHARRFPDGALVELRELGVALLHCREADADRALELVDGFAQRFPGSPHLSRLSRECPRASTR